MGEELNQLMLDGCRVFHDYPAQPKWNIDHIVVAASGVFAVETKTRTKRRLSPGKDHRIIFDGGTLRFPRYHSSDSLDQARRNATWLAGELSRVTSEKVTVKPILTYPGWFIDRRGKGDVAVLNPREVRQMIVTNNPQLSSEQINRICAWLTEKCRDVEF